MNRCVGGTEETGSSGVSNKINSDRFHHNALGEPNSVRNLDEEENKVGCPAKFEFKRGNSGSPPLPTCTSSKGAGQSERFAHVGKVVLATPLTIERKMEHELLRKSPNVPGHFDQLTMDEMEEFLTDDEDHPVPRQWNIPEYQSSEEDDSTMTPLRQTISRFSDVLRNSIQSLTYQQLLGSSCTEFLLSAFKTYKPMSKYDAVNSQELAEDSTREFVEVYHVLRQTAMTTEMFFDEDAFHIEGKGANRIKDIFSKPVINLDSTMSTENKNLLRDKMDEFSQHALQRLVNMATQDNSNQIVQLCKTIISREKTLSYQNKFAQNIQQPSSISPAISLNPKRNYGNTQLEPGLKKIQNELSETNSITMAKKITKSESSKKRINLSAVKRTPQDFVPKRIICLYEKILGTHLEEITIKQLHLEDEQLFFAKVNEDYVQQEKVKPTGEQAARLLEDAKKLYKILKAKVILMEEAFDQMICFLQDEMVGKCTELFSPEDSSSVPPCLLELFQSKMNAFSQEYLERNELILNAEMNSASELIQNSVKFYSQEMEKNLADSSLDEESLQNLHLQISATTIENFLRSYDCKNPNLTIQLTADLQTKILNSQKMLSEDYERRRARLEDHETKFGSGDPVKSVDKILPESDNCSSNFHDNHEADGFVIFGKDSSLKDSEANENEYQTRAGVEPTFSTTRPKTSPSVVPLPLPTDDFEATFADRAIGPPLGWRSEERINTEETLTTSTSTPLDNVEGDGNNKKIQLGSGRSLSIAERLRARKQPKGEE